MKISFYPLFTLLLLVTNSWGQGFSKTYLPASSQFNDVVTTSDGGYFMAGSTAADSTVFLQRVGPTGNVVWAKHLDLHGAQAIATCSAPDGGFVVLVEYYATPQGFKNLILKVSSSGVTEWQRQIDNTLLANGLRDIIPTSDGQFLAAGDTRNAQFQQNIWLVKLDAAGNITWSKSVGDALYNEQVSRLLQLPNGHIIISGDALHDVDRDLFLTKTDADGNLLWEKWYVQPNTQNAQDLSLLSDGGLAVLADTYGENPAKAAILRTDGDGVLDFYKNITNILIPDDTNLPSYAVTTFTTDEVGNFFVPIIILSNPNTTAAYKTELLKFDAFGDSVWHKPIIDGLAQQIVRTTGGYFAIVGGVHKDFNDPGAFMVVTDAFGEIYTNKLSGALYHDENDNCTQDNGEPYLGQFIVRAENELGETFFANVLPSGGFLLKVSAGNFTVSVSPRYGTTNFWVPCDSQVVNVTGSNGFISLPPLGLRSTVDCPLLDIEIGAAFLRRCTTSVFNVNYCNNGNLTATNASVQITPDAYMSYQSSTIPLTSQTGNVLTFNLPNVLPGDCKIFNITFLVSCEAELGEVLCAEAHIFPDSTCLPPNANWDGSHLLVSGACNGDIAFTIRNAGMGNMTTTSDYVIIEDQIMLTQGQVQLNAGQDTTITVSNPLNADYQLRVKQTPGHPGQSHPSATVQRCAGDNTSGLALQLPQNDNDPFIAIHCDAIIGSFDPNDKRGFPLGWQDAHFIERGQELEYMIRLQNTGTDTAFSVIVRDTITSLLDITSLRTGASSHPYTYSVSGEGIITFQFGNILLPDSNVNEAASHGYVMFRLRQSPNLALGSVIENRVGIYFDFNAPVITNTSFHTIGQPLIITTVEHLADSDLDLQVFPNPLADQVTFRVNGFPTDGRFQLSLFNVDGGLIRQEQFGGTDFQFQRNSLVPGIYFFQLTEKNGRTARGKIVVAQVRE